MLSKEEKEKAYWKGYIAKQNEAMKICRQCKYRKKLEQPKTREQKLIEKLEERIQSVKKCYDEMLTGMGKIKIINVSGLSKKEKKEVINKKNCLLIQKHCYEEILAMLKGENDE